MNNFLPVTREQLDQPGFSILEIPPQWRDDPLIRDRLYFILPHQLMDRVVEQVGRSRFESSALQREADLEKSLGKNLGVVAYWNRSPVQYKFLSPFEPALPFAGRGGVYGKSEAEFSDIMKLAETRLETFNQPLRGFVGWLMTQSSFITEHDKLVSKHWDRVKSFGFPLPMQIAPSKGLIESAEDQDWVAEFREFYFRWRLQTLAAPGLPVPLAPRVPDSMGKCQPGSNEGHQSIVIPDICPIPGIGSLVESIEDALRGSPPPNHLRDWMDIVRRENCARNQIPTLERRFRLQHYWRVLKLRYRKALTRKKGALVVAFHGFLGVSEDTIKGDLRYLSRRLGADWDTRSVHFC